MTPAHDTPTDLIAADVDALCAMRPDRHVGSPGNREATAMMASAFEATGCEVRRLPFECVDWVPGAVELAASGEHFSAWCGPYSPPVSLDAATLVAAGSSEELESLGDLGDSVLLIHGALAAEQLVPRDYPFYNTDSSRRVLAALDRIRPAAVVAATGSNPGSVGALSPFPVAEDAAFGFPSAYLGEDDGRRLLAHAGAPVRLTIDSATPASTGEQVVATRAGDARGRVVVSAHVDARFGTPGAIDNATGAACLLAIARLAQRSDAPLPTLELVPFNGEDNFAAYGEVAYLRDRREDLSDITLAINLDAAGLAGATTHVSFYGCDDALTGRIRGLFERFETVSEGPSWPASDHMVFAMRGVSALAITTSELARASGTYTHTALDTPKIVDPSLIADAAAFVVALAQLIGE